MEFDHKKYQEYVRILNEELVPAMGCTEPIAIAYCAALMKETLGNKPTKVIINVAQYAIAIGSVHPIAGTNSSLRIRTYS